MGSTAIGRSGTVVVQLLGRCHCRDNIFDDVLSDVGETIEEQLHDKWFGPLALKISAVHFTAVKCLREGQPMLKPGLQ